MDVSKTRVVDTTQYVSMLRDLTEEGQEVSMVIAGSSMVPFLVHGRDRIFFSSPQHDPVRGDMVFYRRTNGQYVMHRVYCVSAEGYFMLGDAQTEVEGPLKREQIFAIVNRVERKGKLIDANDRWWRFFAGPWLMLRRFRPLIRSLYGFFAAFWRSQDVSEKS